MYMCARGIEFVSFCDMAIGFWNSADSVVFFSYILFIYILCKKNKSGVFLLDIAVR